jgi:hypothetical protein
MLDEIVRLADAPPPFVGKERMGAAAMISVESALPEQLRCLLFA